MDLISGMEDGTITCYDQGDFTDLCRGPHVDNVKLCRNFKLVKHSGAYFKGDATKQMLNRVYGVCFPTPEELEEHLKLLEEAKERDHRKIGKDMQLFMSDDLVGRGLPMFLPNGYIIWQELENYIRTKEQKLGYQHVMTPCVGTVALYQTSGHWDHYKENMFPAMEVEDEVYVLAVEPLEEAASYDAAYTLEAETTLKDVYQHLLETSGYSAKYKTLLQKQMAIDSTCVLQLQQLQVQQELHGK